MTAPKPAEERMWKNEYLVKVEQEGLASIKEDSVYPRKSLRYTFCSNSQGFLLTN